MSASMSTDRGGLSTFSSVGTSLGIISLAVRQKGAFSVAYGTDGGLAPRCGMRGGYLAVARCTGTRGTFNEGEGYSMAVAITSALASLGLRAGINSISLSNLGILTLSLHTSIKSVSLRGYALRASALSTGINSVSLRSYAFASVRVADGIKSISLSYGRSLSSCRVRLKANIKSMGIGSACYRHDCSGRNSSSRSLAVSGSAKSVDLAC